MKFSQKIFSSYGSLSLSNETVSALVTCLSATEAIEGFFAGTDRVSFILHCTLFHASPKAFVETTMPVDFLNEKLVKSMTDYFCD